jgi:diaminopimelate decarboxylase
LKVADLLSEHGSPLWLVNLDVVRDRYRAFAEAWRREWPDVRIAYSYKANRQPAILRALAAKGAGHQVACELEYELARAVANADGADVIVHGPAKPPGLLERAGADGALVVADSLSELRAAGAAGVRRVGVRVGLPGVGHGPSHFGVPLAEAGGAPRRAAALGLRVEALAAHLVSAGFDRPLDEVSRLAGALVVRWPQPPERFAHAARMLASLAVRLRVPTVDLGGGFPSAQSEAVYARAVAAALGSSGFEGRLIVEPGRALVADAVELACTVSAVKRIPDGRRCVIVDAGTSLITSALFRWPAIEVPEAQDAGPARPALVTGPLTTNVDVLHPTAALPPLSPGDPILVRGIGAYNQSHASQFGDLRPAVVVRDDGRWRLSARRETLDDLLAIDLETELTEAGRSGRG